MQNACGNSTMFTLFCELVRSRSNVSPKRLGAQGPTTEQMNELFTLAAAAPDHAMLTPWRFVLVPSNKRSLLAEVFAAALLDRDADATLEQLEVARAKAYRAPVLIIAVARLGECKPDTPALERMVSMGAAIQNILLGAHAMGFGAGLTSGKAMASHRMRGLCQLKDGESAVCCLNLGTVTQHKPSSRVRPLPAQFLSVLQ
jgi:nitroreductase